MVTGSGSRPHACRLRALEPRADRPAERLVLRVRLGGGEQRVEPARPHLDVVVEEAQQLARGGVDRGVAGDVDARAARRARRSGRRGRVDEPLASPGRPGRPRRRRSRRRARPPAAPRRRARPRGSRGGGGSGSRSRRAAPCARSSARLCARRDPAAAQPLPPPGRRGAGGRGPRVADPRAPRRGRRGARARLGRARQPPRGARAAARRAGARRRSRTPSGARGARVVHAHNVNPTFGWRALAAAREAGARVVLHLHNYRLVCAVGTVLHARRGLHALPRPQHAARACGSTAAAARARSRPPTRAGLALWQRRLARAGGRVRRPERVRAAAACASSARRSATARTCVGSVQREFADALAPPPSGRVRARRRPAHAREGLRRRDRGVPRGRPAARDRRRRPAGGRAARARRRRRRALHGRARRRPSSRALRARRRRRRSCRRATRRSSRSPRSRRWPPALPAVAAALRRADRGRARGGPATRPATSTRSPTRLRALWRDAEAGERALAVVRERCAPEAVAAAAARALRGAATPRPPPGCERHAPSASSLPVLASSRVSAPSRRRAREQKKGIWGPVRVDGVSQFPIYRELGAGVYHTSLLVGQGRDVGGPSGRATRSTPPTTGRPRSTTRSRGRRSRDRGRADGQGHAGVGPTAAGRRPGPDAPTRLRRLHGRDGQALPVGPLLGVWGAVPPGELHPLPANTPPGSRSTRADVPRRIATRGCWTTIRRDQAGQPSAAPASSAATRSRFGDIGPRQLDQEPPCRPAGHRGWTCMATILFARATPRPRSRALLPRHCRDFSDLDDMTRLDRPLPWLHARGAGVSGSGSASTR